MRRFVAFVSLLFAIVSCSKNEGGQPLPPTVIPDNITGTVQEFNVTPVGVTTPDKGFFTIAMNDVLYKVAFTAVDSAQSNAVLYIATDSVLTSESREYTNLGRDAVSYYPVYENEIEIRFKDGRKINGLFAPLATSFGGTFGEQVIAQWREPSDPTKPTQKAKDDIKALMGRYADKNGPEPGIAPTYLNVTVSKP